MCILYMYSGNLMGSLTCALMAVKELYTYLQVSLYIEVRG